MNVASRVVAACSVRRGALWRGMVIAAPMSRGAAQWRRYVRQRSVLNPVRVLLWSFTIKIASTAIEAFTGRRLNMCRVQREVAAEMSVAEKNQRVVQKWQRQRRKWVNRRNTRGVPPQGAVMLSARPPNSGNAPARVVVCVCETFNHVAVNGNDSGQPAVPKSSFRVTRVREER